MWCFFHVLCQHRYRLIIQNSLCTVHFVVVVLVACYFCFLNCGNHMYALSAMLSAMLLLSFIFGPFYLKGTPWVAWVFFGIFKGQNLFFHLEKKNRTKVIKHCKFLKKIKTEMSHKKLVYNMPFLYHTLCTDSTQFTTTICLWHSLY